MAAGLFGAAIATAQENAGLADRHHPTTTAPACQVSTVTVPRECGGYGYGQCESYCKNHPQISTTTTTVYPTSQPPSM